MILFCKRDCKMKLKIAIILTTFIFLRGGSSFSSPMPVVPAHLISYYESILVKPNGEATSHINLQLGGFSEEIYLPLLINDKITLLNSLDKIQTSISEIANNKYLVLRSKDNNPLDKNIQLDIAYGNLIDDNHLWHILDAPNFLIDYSELDNYQVKIDDYRAKITLPDNLALEWPYDAPEQLGSQLISIEYINNDQNNEVNLTASNLSFDDIELIMTIKNSSSLLTPYILIIALLIIVYVVFLRYVFVG